VFKLSCLSCEVENWVPVGGKRRLAFNVLGGIGRRAIQLSGEHGGRGRLHASPFSVLSYGIGGLGTGATPQIADAQGGSCGVGIRKALPCLDGEQLGSDAGSQVMQAPVKVLISG
jgi:hypothetical protein